MALVSYALHRSLVGDVRDILVGCFCACVCVCAWVCVCVWISGCGSCLGLGRQVGGIRMSRYRLMIKSAQECFELGLGLRLLLRVSGLLFGLKVGLLKC